MSGPHPTSIVEHVESCPWWRAHYFKEVRVDNMRLAIVVAPPLQYAAANSSSVEVSFQADHDR